jgi:hypothetical protein
LLIFPFNHPVPAIPAASWKTFTGVAAEKSSTLTAIRSVMAS